MNQAGVTIPLDTHTTAVRNLWKMNINAATLFPGLDGFARSLAYYVDYFHRRG
jgi:hypothetical protein